MKRTFVMSGVILICIPFFALAYKTRPVSPAVRTNSLVMPRSELRDGDTMKARNTALLRTPKKKTGGKKSKEFVFLTKTSQAQFDFCKKNGDPRCFEDIGFLNREENICYILAERGPRNNCWHMLAYAVPKIEICNRIVVRQGSEPPEKMNCIKNVAQNARDPRFCDLITMTAEQKRRFDEINKLRKVLNSDQEACLVGVKYGPYYPYQEYRQDLEQRAGPSVKIKIKKENALDINTYDAMVAHIQKKDNYKLCRNSFHSSWTWDPCERAVLAAAGNKERCTVLYHYDKEGFYDPRTMCLIEATKDLTYCENLEKERYSTSCFLDYLFLLNESRCRQLDRYSNDCLAIVHEDPSRCLHDFCFIGIARKTGNSMLCDRVQDERERHDCRVLSFIKKRDVTQCKIFSEELLVRRCIEKLAFEINDKKICAPLSGDLKQYCLYATKDAAVE